MMKGARNFSRDAEEIREREEAEKRRFEREAQVKKMLAEWDFRVQKKTEEGIKHDIGKPRWDLLPWRGVSKVVGVLTHGAEKYGENNWQRVANPRDRYFAAAMRHLVAWRGGESRDTESGHSHLAHAICCLLFLLWVGDNEKTSSQN